MTTLTQANFTEQMLAQLRLLQPSISAFVGTPERAIFDTVGEALANNQIDLLGLENALNLDSKFGSNLDSFLAIFSFERQAPTTAEGFVVFSRNVPAEQDITIPQGVLLQCNVATVEGINVQFTTKTGAVLSAGDTQTSLVPIVAINSGSNGDVAANTITIMTGEPVKGITAVTNPTATGGGQDREDDNSFKVRFKNTVFRNLSGTVDQFLALAVATAFSKKANVVGPVSQYQEYVQVPFKDDSNAYDYGGGAVYSGAPVPIVTLGSVPSSSTTLTIPSTLGIAPGEAVVIFNNGDNPVQVFEGTVGSVKTATTLTLSGSPELEGNPVTLTNVVCLIGAKETVAVEHKWTTTLSTIPYAKNIWSANPVFISNGQIGVGDFFFREGVDFNFNFPGLFQGDTLRAFIDGTGIDPLTDPLGITQPNITFINVYTGSNEAVQAIGPSQVVLLEYSYTSSSSRNDLSHNVTNAVDVFVDGGNNQPSTTVFTAPLASSEMIFVDNPNSMFYYENYRRDGEPAKRPVIGNVLTPLYQQPVVSLPAQITIGESNYYLGTHYWLVHDVSNYAGTIRARDGIEWSSAMGGDSTSLGTPVEPTEALPAYKGSFFNNLAANTAVEVENYSFDQNIRDLQATLLGVKQITTDVLAHKARLRFFKLDITVVYSPSSAPSQVNKQIESALSTFLASQYFGAVIRLSDLLQIIHNTPGVENVRWSNDVPNTSNTVRVIETDNAGNSLTRVSVDRIQGGTGSTKEVQGLYITGKPTGGNFTVNYNLGLPISVEVKNLTATTLATTINFNLGGSDVTVTEDVRSTVDVTEPIRSFVITFTANGAKELPVINRDEPLQKTITGGRNTFDTDFFLRDDELPALPEGATIGDTLPGLIIRPRAENTWQRAN